jgi:hypothetical protein
MTANTTPQPPRSRRALLAGAIGGLGVWAASAIGRAAPADAAAGDPIRMGRLNTAGGTTTTLRTKTSAVAFDVQNMADSAGSGVLGFAAGSSGVGVDGLAPDGFGVAGRGGRVGVRGDGPVGVLGQSPRRSGVFGLTDEGFAVHGQANRNSGFAGYFDGKVFTRRYIEVGKVVVPEAPKADLARLFVRDAGAGKLQLCVRFPTGPVQVIATEP